MPLVVLLLVFAFLALVVVPGVYLFAFYVLFPCAVLCVAAYIAWLLFPPVRDYWNEAKLHISVERPEYWTLGIGAVLAVALILIQREADAFEWGNFKNCLYFRSPCDFPVGTVLWFLLAHAFAIGGLLGVGSFFELKGLYPPSTNPLRHFIAYVVLALSLLIICINWPRLSLVLAIFVGLPVGTRFLYVHGRRAAAVEAKHQEIEQLTKMFPSEEEFVARVMRDL